MPNSTIYSIGVTIDGFTADRDGDFNWTAPDDELFRFHTTEQVGQLGAYILGRRLYEAMLVWETDPAMRADPDRAAFSDLWRALPKVVFSRTLDSVQGTNTRLATGSIADEVAALRATTDREISIGGPDLAAQAFELGLIDELRIFRHPVVVGGGTPHLPAVTSRMAFELAETRMFPSSVLYERYRRVD